MQISRIFGKTEKEQGIMKRMLLGGLSNSLIYWANMYAMYYVPGYPQELKNRVEPHMPENANILTSLAPPATLFVAKKVVKSTGKKEKVGDMALGATLYGVPNFVHDIVVQTAYVEGVNSRPTARLSPTSAAMSRYTVNSPQYNRPVAAASSLSKYRVTS